MINKKLLIIGAGIGGLTAAIALKRIGYEPVVFERTPMYISNGTTLVLWPNAMKVFHILGLSEDVMAIGVRNDKTNVNTSTGKPIYELHFRQFEYGYPVMTVLRADLHRLLLDRLGTDLIRWGKEFVHAEQDKQQVIVHFADGSMDRGALLIGADGIHSKVRQAMKGDVKLRYGGYAAYRGMVANNPANLPPHVGMEFWGEGKRFGLFHTGREGVYWFATMNCLEGDEDSPAGRKQDLLTGFAGWQSSVEQTLLHTDESKILRHSIYDIPPMYSWTQGRITLLGDAAHAMTPNLGQGACQAIEDSGILGECVQKENNLISALRRYEALRIPRVRKLVQMSYRMGRATQWSNPFLCRLRNQAFSMMPSSLMLRQLERIIH
jgi:FAD-dependent urate hydroxylase